VVIYFQIVGAEIRVIDCDSDLDFTPVQRVAHLLAKGYLYGSHFLPHDAIATQKSGKTFLTELGEVGLRNCKLSREHSTSGRALIGFVRSCPGSAFASRHVNAYLRDLAITARSGLPPAAWP
jgi:hypothetical protein